MHKQPGVANESVQVKENWLREVADKRKAERLAAKLESEKAEAAAKKEHGEAQKAAEEAKRAEKDALLQEEMELRMVKLKHIQEKHSANTIRVRFKYLEVHTDILGRLL
jgi:hypothetical protein